MIEHFKKWSNNPDNAGVFVDWWHHKKVFDTSSDVWSKISEKVIAAKKILERKDPNAYANRMIAKSMTNDEFEAWFKSNANQNRVDLVD